MLPAPVGLGCPHDQQACWLLCCWPAAAAGRLPACCWAGTTPSRPLCGCSKLLPCCVKGSMMGCRWPAMKKEQQFATQGRPWWCCNTDNTAAAWRTAPALPPRHATAVTDPVESCCCKPRTRPALSEGEQLLFRLLPVLLASSCWQGGAAVRFISLALCTWIAPASASVRAAVAAFGLLNPIPEGVIFVCWEASSSPVVREGSLNRRAHSWSLVWKAVINEPPPGRQGPPAATGRLTNTAAQA